MYIEINSDQRTIPQILFKKERHSNVIKKSDVLIYTEAKSLLSALEERVEQYQQLVEEQVVHLIEEKEQALNLHVADLHNEMEDKLMVNQALWFEKANQQLTELVAAQYHSLNTLKDELKSTIATKVKSRLPSLSLNEAVIGHLIDLLHKAIDDEDNTLSVEQVFENGGVVLTIESEDNLVSIDTLSIVEELGRSLDSI
ncbi:hypothetical protein FM037_21970 [Shewanella psychropiezotolerans]|uniref:Uncharacterized protein n=2 Tax=Shewanella TaxID=22 RepID=A0A1S6HQ46_9GAMM|nr:MULTISPECIES: hypothetical protein [Shewanella]AQS37653.1 hypothetical protein Sps_02499 [Shewanella psychrophila]MPY23340.1 hypothetical protein [Shewanella sp. YLB-07]QDO85429.1 hypothetical protein FM037_21970 [Shewanella psychropiezotolerans]